MKSRNKKEQNIIIMHPKECVGFVGHQNVVAMLEGVLQSERVPQSWLFSGPKGVGKATLVYRFARALLAGCDDDLNVVADHPVFKRICAGSHTDLMVLEPSGDSVSGEVKVDDIRRMKDFLSLTAAESKCRIVIVDSVDDLNVNAANALLKLLEEPPEKAVFLLVSHVPGRLLPTIKSRCRQVRMVEMSRVDSAAVVRDALPGIDMFEVERVVKLAEGAPGLAVQLYIDDGFEIYAKIIDVLKSLPLLDRAMVSGLCDCVTKKDDRGKWYAMSYMLVSLLARIIRAKSVGVSLEGDEVGLLEEKSAVEVMQILERVTNLMRDVDSIYLDKRAVIVSMFEDFC